MAFMGLMEGFVRLVFVLLCIENAVDLYDCSTCVNFTSRFAPRSSLIILL